MSVHVNPCDALARQLHERPQFRGPGFDWLSSRDMREAGRTVQELLTVYDLITERMPEEPLR